MSAFTMPFPASGALLVVDAAAGQACSSCHRAAALLVVRWVGARQMARCLTCDLGAA